MFNSDHNTARDRLRGSERQAGPQGHKKEVAGEKKGSGESSLSSNRRLCLIRGRRHICSHRGWTMAEGFYGPGTVLSAACSLLYWIYHERPVKQRVLCFFSTWRNGVSGKWNKLPRVIDKPDTNSHFSELPSLQALSPNTNKTHSLEPEE